VPVRRAPLIAPGYAVTFWMRVQLVFILLLSVAWTTDSTRDAVQ
jgi:hypothetical protein